MTNLMNHAVKVTEQIRHYLLAEIGVENPAVEAFTCPKCGTQYQPEEFVRFSGSIWSVSSVIPSWGTHWDSQELCVPCRNKLAQQYEPRPRLIRAIAHTGRLGHWLYNQWHTVD